MSHHVRDLAAISYQKRLDLFHLTQVYQYADNDSAQTTQARSVDVGDILVSLSQARRLRGHHNANTRQDEGPLGHRLTLDAGTGRKHTAYHGRSILSGRRQGDQQPSKTTWEVR